MANVGDVLPKVSKAGSAPTREQPYWGQLGQEIRTVVVPNPGVTINGQLFLGKCDVTFDQRDQIMSMLSMRMEHELKSRFGEKESNRVIDLLGSQSLQDVF